MDQNNTLNLITAQLNDNLITAQPNDNVMTAQPNDSLITRNKLPKFYLKHQMKIALLGYGKMGKAIEAETLKRGHTIFLRIDSEEEWKTKENLLSQADVAIEFSMPDMAVANIHKCFSCNTSVVVGTTGWEKEFDTIKKECLDGDNSMFVASNFSIGMNVFFEVNKKLAQLMNRFGEFDVSIEELHHKHKLDAPSGTAKVLADQIIKEIERKNKWVSGKGSSADELNIFSKREAEAPGTHLVSYLSEMEKIEIVHTAFDRRVFAKGAVMAAEWLQGKQGFFGMGDFLFD